MITHVGLRINGGLPACAITFTIRGRTFKIGAWFYGWDNPAYYKRFDHFRMQAVTWRYGNNKRHSSPQQGLDLTFVLRENGKWLPFPRRFR